MFFKLLPKFRENFRRKSFELKLILISSNYSQCHGSSDRLRLGVIASHIIISTGFPLTPKIFENFWLSDLVFENLKIFSKSKNIFGLLKIKIPKFKNLKVGWTFEKKIFSRIFGAHLHQNSWKFSKNVQIRSYSKVTQKSNTSQSRRTKKWKWTVTCAHFKSFWAKTVQFWL